MKNERIHPGEVIFGKGQVTINPGRKATKLIVKNTGDRPIQVGSHFHFFEVNKALDFDRAKAFGKRLDIPAGTSVRFEPGDEKEIALIEFGGKKFVWGFNSLTQGSIKSEAVFKKALQKAKAAGYKGA